MKKLVKLVITTFCVCSVFSLGSCGSVQEKAENVNNSENSVSTTASSEDSSETLPDKQTLQAVPDEAVNALNGVIEQTKKDFSNQKGKNLFGYQGKQKINNVDCYIFVVYNENDETYTNLGTYASVEKTGELYKLNVSTNKFEKCQTEVQAQELSWADTQTESFAKYLSSNKEDSVQSKEDSKSVEK